MDSNRILSVLYIFILYFYVLKKSRLGDDISRVILHPSCITSMFALGHGHE